MENMELWKKVETTPKEIIKEIDGDDGIKLKTVPSINRVKKATEIFGIYGKNWGLKNVIHTEQRINNSFILGVVDAVFYVSEGDYKTEFAISNSTPIISVQNKEFKINPSYRKSLETDTINKALSRLGFNADIYTDEELVKTAMEVEDEMLGVDFVDIGEKDDTQ